MWTKSRKVLEPYEAPSWASSLKVKPKFKVKLANTPTLIHYWNLPGLPEGVDVYIKREDMTGSTLTGNKVRKLELLLADAIDQGYNDVITAGSLSSNHVRCTAMASRELGLQAHCIYGTNKSAQHQNGGNLLLTKMAGGVGYLIDIENNKHVFSAVEEIANQISDEIRKKNGKGCYLVPIGGTTTLSSFAYMDCYQEMLDQGITEHITDIVVTCGSGGTVAALAVANHLVNGDKIRVHGVSISHGVDTMYAVTDKLLQELGISGVTARDIVHITDYRGDGYGNIKPEEREFIIDVCKLSGILLDTVFCGKGAYGMIKELHSNPSSFKGNKIIFIHSGGVFVNLSTGNIEEFDQVTEWQCKTLQ